MPTLVNSKKLQFLFQSFRERNQLAFFQIAEGIIAEELAANHFDNAKMLKQALGDETNGLMSNSKSSQLSVLPKDRRNGEDLLYLDQSSVTPDRVTLSKQTGRRIERILEEHRRRSRLSEYGLEPKNKLLFWGPPGTGKTLTVDNPGVAFYFSLVTMTTVGFGDYLPTNALGRWLTVAQMSVTLLFIIFLVPALMSIFSPLLAQGRSKT
jgi:hypothetical protein